MVKITKTADNAELGYTDNLVYIKLADNGCFVLCPKNEATGVVFNGTPYHIFTAPPLKDGCEDVAVTPVDGGHISYGHGLSINELENVICENDAVYSAEMANLENAMCEQDGKENANG